MFRPHDELALVFKKKARNRALRQGDWLFTLRAMMHNTTSLNPGLTEERRRTCRL